MRVCAIAVARATAVAILAAQDARLARQARQGREAMSVELTIEGAVAVVTLNRPEKKNALTVEMREGLIAHFQRLRFDDDIRAIVLTGAGEAFCAGADVERMGDADMRAARQRLQRLSHTYMRILHAIEKPVIAAVRGHAVGIGWSLVLGCDMVVASQTAVFSQIFRRIALGPDGGAIWYLTRRLGMNLAKELVFTARMVGADEALRLGLVNHVVADAELMDRAMAMAQEMAEGPTFAMGLAKKLFHMATSVSLEDYLDMESLVQPQLSHMRDHQEGKAAFREKRKPKFSGR
jgi:2-(1,2-epoxy-1,2-dihydrophenyl)acetyl-CoA isomerase